MRKFLLRTVCTLVVISIYLAPHLAAQSADTAAISLSVGNKYYFFIGDYPGLQSLYSYFTENIPKDTVIQGKRYAVIINSRILTPRYERADARNVYEWVNGVERKKFSFDAKLGDTVSNILVIKIGEPNLALGRYTTSGMNLREEDYRHPNSFIVTDSSMILRPVNPLTGIAGTSLAYYARRFGIRSSAIIEPRTFREIAGFFLHAARIDGVLYGDTLYGKRGTDVLLPYSATAIQPAPNPFSEQMSFDITLFAPTDLTVYIVHAVTGQVIRSFPKTRAGAGKYSQTWDGKDNFGASVPSGAYIA